MKVFVRPRSLLGLLFTSLLVVTLPLLIAVTVAVFKVDRLARQSATAVLNAEVETKARLGLIEHLTAMERAALQSLVLEDPAIYQAYTESRAAFLNAAHDLDWLDKPGNAADPLDKLLDQERQLFEMIEQRPHGAENQPAIATAFSSLRPLARRVVTHSSRRIWLRAVATSDEASAANRTLLWLAGISVPATGLLVWLLLLLIHRPLRQIDRAIRALGAGRFETPIQVYGGSRDLEELGERLDWLRSKLTEQDAAKTAFLRHISHELKTPLTAIREGAALLCESSAAPTTLNADEEQAQIASIVLDNSVQLQRLIENLLQLSAASSLANPPSQKTLKMAEIIRRVVEDHRLTLAARGLQVECRLNDVVVVGDPELLRIVFDNIFSNAVKFAPADSHIRVSLEQQDGLAIIDVQDSGPGIAAFEREQIFEPFFQGSARAAGPVRGTGLGLAIAKEFVKAHHGSIEIIDSADGAHLRVSIPLYPPPGSPPPGSPPPGSPPPGNND